jgi:hypothetical protein
MSAGNGEKEVAGMTQIHSIDKTRTTMDTILQYDKSLIVEKLKLGEAPSDAIRCDLEQIFGMTAHIREMPIDGLVENDRASLDESLGQINSLFREICEHDAAVIEEEAERLRQRIRERADHLYDVTLSWRGLINFLYEST